MTETLVFASAADVQAAVGVEAGPSDWLTIEQDRVNGFADDTNDHQWIHVDLERAAQGPFGGPIAHGFLTLSLLPYFVNELRRVENLAMGVNYGLNKVRFPAPVRVGDRLRARMTVVECEPMGDGGLQIVTRAVIELDGNDKPACVAELVTRYYFTNYAARRPDRDTSRAARRSRGRDAGRRRAPFL